MSFITVSGQNRWGYGIEIGYLSKRYFHKKILFINYREGHYAFDLVNVTEKLREIIKETFNFLVKHLKTME